MSCPRLRYAAVQSDWLCAVLAHASAFAFTVVAALALPLLVPLPVPTAFAFAAQLCLLPLLVASAFCPVGG